VWNHPLRRGGLLQNLCRTTTKGCPNGLQIGLELDSSLKKSMETLELNLKAKKEVSTAEIKPNTYTLIFKDNSTITYTTYVEAYKAYMDFKTQGLMW
jgi:hypothetical protein